VLCLIGIGFLILFALWIVAIVFAIVAAVKASDRGFYRYPFTIRLVTG
jgi:uncharacterized Tic20 family protein